MQNPYCILRSHDQPGRATQPHDLPRAGLRHEADFRMPALVVRSSSARSLTPRSRASWWNGATSLADGRGGGVPQDDAQAASRPGPLPGHGARRPDHRRHLGDAGPGASLGRAGRPTRHRSRHHWHPRPFRQPQRPVVRFRRPWRPWHDLLLPAPAAAPAQAGVHRGGKPSQSAHHSIAEPGSGHNQSQSGPTAWLW
jgi:hypothetical protein